jgi:hypothetical protein
MAELYPIKPLPGHLAGGKDADNDGVAFGIGDKKE